MGCWSCEPGTIPLVVAESDWMTAVEATLAARAPPPCREPARPLPPDLGFVSPAPIAIGVFSAVPVAAALLLSLADFDTCALGNLHSPHFGGLDNYLKWFSTPQFLGGRWSLRSYRPRPRLQPRWRAPCY